MIGGEHLRERFSERIQALENQPKHRGYLPGTHLRTGDGGGYGTKTLQGNWVEERRDAAYYDGKPTLPTDLDRVWQSTYGHAMNQSGSKGAQSPFLSQAVMTEVVDAERRAFPGHQKQLDQSAGTNAALLSTTHVTYANPADTRAKHGEHVAPVKGGTPGAQGKAVTLRLRHRLLQSGAPNLIANLRRSLRNADTSKSGSINVQELQRGCQDARAPLDDVEARVLIKSLDKAGSGLAPVEDIVQTVRGEFTERRVALADKCFTLLLRVCGGSVSFRRVLELYDAAQHPDVVANKTSLEAAVNYFASQWDIANLDEVVERSEFVRVYADWSFEIGSDLAFEIMIRNTWHLSGGEGKSENTSCRRVQVVHTNGRVTVEEIKDDLGVGDDVDAIRQNLVNQGIRDIAKIEFSIKKK